MKFGFGPTKKDLAVVFNFLARFGSRSPTTYCACLPLPVVPSPPSSTAPAPAAGKRPHQRLREFHPNPPHLPAPTNPLNSRALASPPGPLPAEIRDKAAIFFLGFALLLSFPAGPFAFASRATPPRSAPLFLLLIVFSRRKARFFEGGDRRFASGGVDSVPRCGFAPNFASGEGIMDFRFCF